MYIILRVCLDGTASKTKIVYDANLNFTRLKKYLNLLLNMGYLIEENNPSKKVVYRTTKAGKLFIGSFSWKRQAARNKR
jgi:predicted transcriptional regulator